MAYTPPAPPEPIPVEGDIQIFANPECTEYATGNEYKVYARINVPWGFNGGWTKHSVEQGGNLDCYAPATQAPDDVYSMLLWYDWNATDSQTPYNVGEIVELTASDVGLSVENPVCVFSKP